MLMSKKILWKYFKYSTEYYVPPDIDPFFLKSLQLTVPIHREKNNEIELLNKTTAKTLWASSNLFSLC
jgi:hypothetical protein